MKTSRGGRRSGLRPPETGQISGRGCSSRRPSCLGRICLEEDPPSAPRADPVDSLRGMYERRGSVDRGLCGASPWFVVAGCPGGSSPLAAQVRDECSNPGVQGAQGAAVPRLRRQQGAADDPLFRTTILTTPIYYHQPDPVGEMLTASASPPALSDEVCHVRTLVACQSPGVFKARGDSHQIERSSPANPRLITWTSRARRQARICTSASWQRRRRGQTEPSASAVDPEGASGPSRLCPMLRGPEPQCLTCHVCDGSWGSTSQALPEAVPSTAPSSRDPHDTIRAIYRDALHLPR